MNDRQTKMIKTAVVLVGGRGLRLMPYTQDIPKTMISVGGKPLIHWIIDWLVDNKVKTVIFGVDYKKDVIIDYLKQQKFNIEIKFNDHNGAHGTGDAFRLAIENHRINDKIYIAMNGDELTDLSVKNFLTFHNEHKPLATIMAYPLRSPYGILDIDHEYNITAFREKPVIDNYFINSGIYLFDRQVKNFLPEKGSIEETTFVKLAEIKKIKAFKYFGFWRTIDTVKDLATVEEKIGILKMQEEA